MLEGKICLVTGGGGGIGTATALEMARCGARAVVVTDVHEESGERTADTVRAAGVDSIFARCDITDGAEVRRLMATVEERYGRLDVLHNNAGLLEDSLTEDTRVDQLPESVWDRVFAVNVKGMWLCTKYAVPLLERSGSAVIVNCGSTSSFMAFEGEACYCSTKAAVIGLTRSTALDLASKGIRCVCYCPTSTETGMLRRYFESGDDRAKLEAALTATHLVRRMGRPQDVAKFVCFLASDAASFINGSSHLVDGGALAWRGTAM